MEKADGLKALQNAINKIEATIKEFDGVFNILTAVSGVLLLLLLRLGVFF